jgi:multidrug efflux pump subunit AcrA (membrane-fusion protein)
MIRSRNVLAEIFRIGLPLLILGAGVTTLAVIVGMREPPPRIERAAMVPMVETTTVQQHHGGLDIRSDGMVVPFREIGLSAEVGGRITHKSPDVRAGNYVTQGDLLVTIDPRSYQLEVNRARSEVDQAEARLRELTVDIENTESLLALADERVELQNRHLSRMRQLFDRGASTDGELEEAQQLELNARNDRTSLHNQLRKQQASRDAMLHAKELAEARLATAQLDLERTEVRAPVNGIVVSEMVEQESYVQPGSELMTIEDTSAVEVRCNLRAEELNWILLQAPTSAEPVPRQVRQDFQLPRTPVTIYQRLNGVEHRWDGVLSRFEGIGIDERTRTVPIRIFVANRRAVNLVSEVTQLLPEGPRVLVRGMYVQLLIHADPGTRLLSIPERCVQPGNVVWRVKDGMLNRIILQNQYPLDDSILIPVSASPLVPGDELVISPLTVAADGMPVMVKASTTASRETPRR